MYTSGFWLLPRMMGCSGERADFRCALRASWSMRLCIWAVFRYWIVLISWDVRKPSWKCTMGTRALSVARCATSARSWQSCTHWLESMPQPVARAAITSWWSPKMESAELARDRAATCMTQGSSSPAILYMFGIMSSRPWEDVKVVGRPPTAAEPCRDPAAPASDCSCCTFRLLPNTFLTPFTDHISQISAMGDDGVMGKMKAFSDIRYATCEVAVHPSQAASCCGAFCTAGSMNLSVSVSTEENQSVSTEAKPAKASAPDMPFCLCCCRNFCSVCSWRLSASFARLSTARAWCSSASCACCFLIFASMSSTSDGSAFGFRSRRVVASMRFWPPRTSISVGRLATLDSMVEPLKSWARGRGDRARGGGAGGF
mmetsp:Transcript_97806/g.276849  ORF Transcript_97806/g.276849 Transcript_97806/m.276849 type:complete len:372 (-) Transcript_97806:35-1150(-)